MCTAMTGISLVVFRALTLDSGDNRERLMDFNAVASAERDLLEKAFSEGKSRPLVNRSLSNRHQKEGTSSRNIMSLDQRIARSKTYIIISEEIFWAREPLPAGVTRIARRINAYY